MIMSGDVRNGCWLAGLSAAAILFTSFVFAQTEPLSVTFSKRCLMVNLNEGCAVADVNKDNKPDVIAGTHWYAAPDFVPRPLRDIPIFSCDYHSSSGDHAYDVNGDGWIDVVSVGWMEKEIYWYENPRADGLRKGYPWVRHVLGPAHGMNETMDLHDLDDDGKPEIIIDSWDKKAPLVVYKLVIGADGNPAAEPHEIGQQGSGHGYGVGDINGDGREDILCESGWYERPKGDSFAKPWKLHTETAIPHLCCPLIVTKLTDGGRNDILWGKAHEYGVYWWEQGQPKPDGTTTWSEHLVDKSWSQPHTLAWADIDGDGEPELITGKRVRAHVTGDPGVNEPECLYYYKWDKAARKFTRHTIAGPGEGVGSGVQIRVADLNGDERPDIVVAGKTGTWILLNEGAKRP
jgi:hypothetical protein